MFASHFAVGFAAKRFAPAISLGTLFLAAQFADLLWPTLLLAGVEHATVSPGASGVVPLAFTHYPYSHSLAALLVWGALVAIACRMVGRDWRAAVLVGALVVSHWILDLVAHVPDLPLHPGAPDLFGLGLWRHGGLTLALEAVALALGTWAYARGTHPRNRRGTWGLVGLVALLSAVQVANLLGPPPSGITDVAWAGQAQWLLVAWGYWIDRNRTAAITATR